MSDPANNQAATPAAESAEADVTERVETTGTGVTDAATGAPVSDEAPTTDVDAPTDADQPADADQPTDADAPPPSAGAEGPNAGDAAPTSDKVTRYSFTGLDIDGELRTPALLQFLARIAGEFETLGIPHRSFMPELAATVGEDAL